MPDGLHDDQQNQHEQFDPRDHLDVSTTHASRERQDGDTTRGIGRGDIAERRVLALAPGQALTLGRSIECDVALDDPLVAPRQARLGRQADGAWTLENLDETRPIFVNGLAVRQTRLAPGAEAQLGRSSFVLTGAGLMQSDDLRSIRVDALGLRETVGGGLFGRRRKVVLDDISLSIPPGAFVAIVGGSGAGKTTLLNALNGQRPAQSGAVLYNGRNLYRELAFFSQAQGYVPQDDIIHKYLTVERALYYAARLRLSESLTHEQVSARINQTLEDIDMMAQRHQVIAQLSGGQRKRVSIGVELLAHPGVFFLDEPTSGLDPALDRHIMQLLRKLADRQQTIILTTHTMEHIDLCDDICFLAPGGRLVYFGPPDALRSHFQMDDYADIYTAVQSEPEHWAALFRQSPEYLRSVAGPRLQSENISRSRTATASAPLPPARRPDQLRQLWLLTLRYLEIFRRDKMNLLILFAQAPIIAGLVALLSTHDIVRELTSAPGLSPPPDLGAQRTLFIMVCSAAWFGIINALREIVKERPIYRRERAIYLAIVPYALSKALALGALGLAQSVILLLLVSLRSGYPLHGIVLPGAAGAAVEMLLTLWLVSLAGLAMGLMVSALAPNADRAVSLAPLLLVPQIIFANVIFTLKGGASVLSWIAPSRWGMQALGSIAQVRNPFSGHAHNAFYASTPAHLFSFWLALLGLIALYSALTLLALRRADHRRRTG